LPWAGSLRKIRSNLKFLKEMQKITATELARNLRAVLDRVRETGETYLVERGGQPVVQVSPTPGEQTAQQALADLYRMLPPDAAEGWERDARHGRAGLDETLRDPWAS
jgi:antitoxin (DNA-binding transcriptional repressor) of toxin-antitoxin stability system